MPRGDVIYVDLPMPAGGAGHEQSGNRPAVILQSNNSPTNNPMMMIVPMTSKLTALRFPHTIEVTPSQQNGLRYPSVLLVFQLRAISKGRIQNTVGHLEDQYMRQLESEIKSLLAV
jgi:mRNA interferase MazF